MPAEHFHATDAVTPILTDKTCPQIITEALQGLKELTLHCGQGQ